MAQRGFPNGVRLEPPDRKKLQALIAVLGERAAAAQLAIHRSTLARALGDLPLRKSTARLITLSLHQSGSG